MSEDIPPAEFQRLSRGPVTSTVESWRGLSTQPAFEPADFDLLDLALSVAPDLRAAAVLAKIARERGLAYPIESVDRVAGLLGEEEVIEVGEFIVDARAITEALPPETFPLVHEGEFLSAVHLALLRWRAATAEAWQRAGVERGGAAQATEARNVDQ